MRTTITSGRGALLVHGWPGDLQPPSGTQLLPADGALPTLRAPLGLRGRLRQQLLTAGHSFADALRPEPLATDHLPPCPDPPPPALRTWLLHGGRGIAIGLPEGERIDLLVAAQHHTRTGALVVCRDTGALPVLDRQLRERCPHPIHAVVTAHGALQLPPGQQRGRDLLVLDRPELLPAGQLAPLLACTPCAHTLALLDGADHPDLLAWTGSIGPLLELRRRAEGGTRIELHLPLLREERQQHDAAWHTFLRGYDAYRTLRRDAGFGTFVQQARTDAALRPSLLAWHQARRIAGWNTNKALAVAELLARHRRDRVLVFTPDRASAYQLAQRHLIAPITAELPRAERDQLLQDFAAGRLLCLAGPRLLDLGVPEHSVAVGIVIGGGYGPRQRLAQQRRISASGVVYELVAEHTAEVGRAHRAADARSRSPA
jgi:hypothetical protein